MKHTRTGPPQRGVADSTVPSISRLVRLSGSLSAWVTQRSVPTGSGVREVTTDDEHSVLVEFESDVGAFWRSHRSRPGGRRTTLSRVTGYGSKGTVTFSLPRLNELQVKGPDDAVSSSCWSRNRPTLTWRLVARRLHHRLGAHVRPRERGIHPYRCGRHALPPGLRRRLPGQACRRGHTGE